MPDRNSTVNAGPRYVGVDRPCDQSDPISDAYDAWQRSSARLLELERSLVTQGSVDPRVEALIKEVKVLRSCTVELFVQVSGSVQKVPGAFEPDSKAPKARGSVKAGASAHHDRPPFGY